MSVIIDVVFRRTGQRMRAKGKTPGYTDGGGYWPLFRTVEESLDLLADSIESSVMKLGRDAAISIDIAAADMVDDYGSYRLEGEGNTLSGNAWYDRLSGWIDTYAILMVEAPFGNNDWGNWGRLTNEACSKLMVIGDNLYMTDMDSMRKGMARQESNAVMIKINQIGTVSEILDAITLTRGAGWDQVVSSRSGDTEDVFIAHLAVGINAGWLHPTRRTDSQVE